MEVLRIIVLKPVHASQGPGKIYKKAVKFAVP